MPFEGKGQRVAQNVANNLARFWRWTKNVAGTSTVQKRTEITVQTDRVVVIRQRRSRRVWCQQCGREVNAVSFQEAGELTGVPLLALPDNGASAAWHVCVGENGELVICLESLLKKG